MYTTKMQERILEHIKQSKVSSIPFQGESIRVKEITGLQLIVEVTINQFKAGLNNGDICHVLFDCVDDSNFVVVERLNDSFRSKVPKDVLRIPVEFMKFDQYLNGKTNGHKSIDMDFE